LRRAFGIVLLGLVALSLLLGERAPALRHVGAYSPLLLGLYLLALRTVHAHEAAVTFSALRLRAVDLAVGNLLGSNLFNVVVLAVDDAVYTSGPLLRVAAPVHAATATVAIVMTALVMVGLLVRPRGRVLRLASWVSFGLVALYLLNAALHRLQGA
jgi:cation:H+ antiporter